MTTILHQGLHPLLLCSYSYNTLQIDGNGEKLIMIEIATWVSEHLITGSVPLVLVNLRLHLCLHDHHYHILHSIASYLTYC